MYDDSDYYEETCCEVDDSETTSTLPLDDICALLGVYVGSSACMGFIIGWVVSLFSQCGTFDTQKYIRDVLQAHNCTYPSTHTVDPYCWQWEREASDQAFRVCFYYCGWGFLWGLIFSISTLLLLCILWNRRCLKYTVRNLWYGCGDTLSVCGQKIMEGCIRLKISGKKVSVQLTPLLRPLLTNPFSSTSPPANSLPPSIYPTTLRRTSSDLPPPAIAYVPAFGLQSSTLDGDAVERSRSLTIFSNPTTHYDQRRPHRPPSPPYCHVTFASQTQEYQPPVVPPLTLFSNPTPRPFAFTYRMLSTSTPPQDMSPLSPLTPQDLRGPRGDILSDPTTLRRKTEDILPI